MFTGLYIHWTSLTSRRYKIGIINYLLNRVWNYITNLEERNLEVEKIKNILLNNGYLEHWLGEKVQVMFQYCCFEITIQR